jgi:hemoglobin
MSYSMDSIGGEDRLRSLIEAFVERVASDFIIGFMFEGRDLARICAHEFEWASAHFGSETQYTGRPLGQVHKPLKINGGHFRRRIAILRTVLTESGVSQELIDHWIAREEAMASVIVSTEDCGPSELPDRD